MLMVFSQRLGTEEVWVEAGTESAWLDRFRSWGTPACTLRDYRRWGGFFPPHPESVGDVMCYPQAREAQRRRRSRLRS